MRKIILTALATLCLSGMVFGQTSSGKLGKTVRWVLKDDGTLVVYGKNENTDDYTKKQQRTPFIKNKIADKILVADLTNFSGTIENYVFNNCTNLTTIILTYTEEYTFAPNAFSNCNKLAELKFVPYSYNFEYYNIVCNSIPELERGFVNTTHKFSKVTVIRRYTNTYTKHFNYVERVLNNSKFEPFPSIYTYKNLVEDSGTNNNGDKWKYIGQKQDYRWHGVGKITWSDGDWYIGEWSKGERTGLGEYHWANGNWYIGDFVEDKRTGKGEFHWGKNSKWNGDWYKGDFVKGERTGKGEYHWANGDWYIGEFKDGWFTGKGIKHSKEKGWEAGVWQRDVYQGKTEEISLQEYFDFPEPIPFYIIAQAHITKAINQWQQKGEFETTAQWRKRVTENTILAKNTTVYGIMMKKILVPSIILKFGIISFGIRLVLAV